MDMVYRLPFRDWLELDGKPAPERGRASRGRRQLRRPFHAEK